MDKKLLLHFQLLGEIHEMINSATSIEDALKAGTEKLTERIGFSYAVVWLKDNSQEATLRPIYWKGPLNLTTAKCRPGEDIVGKTFSDVTPFIYRAGQDSSPIDTDMSWLQEIEISGMVCVPLESTYDTMGCIQLINGPDSSPLSDDDINVCEIFAMMLAVSIDQSQLQFEGYTQPNILASLRGIKKGYQSGSEFNMVLKGVDVDIYEGEFLVILGESGCGKSTMLNIIGGMDTATEGQFTFMGEDYTQVDENTLTLYRRNNIGFIFQSYNLMPSMTAAQNLAFIAELCKDPMDVEEALKMVGLGDKTGNYPSQLSGGQQQRISIARALVKKPRLILADEPTAALDYTTSIEVLKVLEDVISRGTTLLMVTHNEEIAKMAHRVIRLKGGFVDSISINRHPASAEDLVW